MKAATLLALPLLIALAAPSGAHAAQPVYRCGNTYSNVPCGDGRAVEATDPRTSAQQTEARRQAAQQRRLGNEMERERVAADARPYMPRAGTLGGTVAPGAEKPTPTKAKSKAKAKARYRGQQPDAEAPPTALLAGKPEPRKK
jgi:hypothetical protein